MAVTIAVAAALLVVVAVTAGVSFGLVKSAAPALQARRLSPATVAPPVIFGPVGLGSALVCGLLALQVPAVNSVFSPDLQRIARELTSPG